MDHSPSPPVDHGGMGNVVESKLMDSNDGSHDVGDRVD